MNTLNKILIRTIEKKDEKDIADIIRNTLAEFGANKPGTVYFDPTTDVLYEVFQKPRSIYYVVLKGDKMIVRRRELSKGIIKVRNS